MGGPKKKNQHYVPQWVLRNFSSNGRAVPTFVLRTGNLIPSASIADQCSADYFYGREPHIEDTFAESEAAVAAIMKRFQAGDTDQFAGPYRCSSFPESIEELNVLKVHPLYLVREYVYYQENRTAAAADAMEESCDEEIKWRLQRDPRFMSKVPDAAELLDKVRIVPPNAIADVLYHAASFHFVTLDLTVKFLVADKPLLLISDHPVVLRNQYAEGLPRAPGTLGMVARGLQMLMPLSPTIAVAVYDGDVYESGHDDNVIVKLSEHNAEILNEMQALNAHECLYVHPDVSVALEPLRARWLARPDVRAVRIEGPMEKRSKGEYSQMVYSVPPELEPARRLRCFQVRDRTTEVVRTKIGDMMSFPIRSHSLTTAAEQIAEMMDWKVKESVKQRGTRVAPEWREWLDKIRDPRKPRPRAR